MEKQNAVVDAIHVKPSLADIVAEGYAPFLSKGGLEGEIEGDVKEVRRHVQRCLPALYFSQYPMSTGYRGRRSR